MRVPAPDSNSQSDFGLVVGPVVELEVELEVESELEAEPGPASGFVVDVGAVFVLAWADGLQQPALQTPLHVKFVFLCVCFFGLGCVLSPGFYLYLTDEGMVPQQEQGQEPDLELEIMPALSLGLLMVVVLQVLLQVELAVELLAKFVLKLAVQLEPRPELGDKPVAEI